MRIIKTESINSWLLENSKKFIKFCEEEYSAQIMDVAAKVAGSSIDCPIVLLAGPSGSGKTISSLRLKEALEKFSHSAKVISMDNYFLSHDDPRNELDETGKLDLESPNRMDKELLAQHIRDIIECRKIEIPVFNFKKQQSQPGELWQRKPGEAVIFEGIHALNPRVTGAAGRDSIGVYVSVRTRLKTEDGELLHPSKVRLSRRFVRDRLFRGRSLLETLEFFEDVERGEALYIMPYKKNARFDIDTFLPYELCAYKDLVLEDLKELAKTREISFDTKTLLNVLLEIGSVNRKAIPEDSLVREFIGESRLFGNKSASNNN